MVLVVHSSVDIIIGTEFAAVETTRAVENKSARFDERESEVLVLVELLLLDVVLNLVTAEPQGRSIGLGHKRKTLALVNCDQGGSRLSLRS